MSLTIPLQNPSRVRSPRLASGESDTREAIVMAALTLFAKHGIDGVSLRQIVTAAGQSNPSAVHYHFRSKEGLVEAVLEHVRAQFVPTQAQALAAMEDSRQRGQLTVRETVRLFLMPTMMIHSASPQGRLSIRFVARLIWQGDDATMVGMMSRYSLTHARVVDLLHELLPYQPKDKLSFLVMAAITNLLHGLADVGVMESHASLGLRPLMASRSAEMATWFVDYVAAGLIGAGVPEQMTQPASEAA